jgi:threonine aldolase
VKKIAKKAKLRLHLDGARLFNALVEQKISPKEYCADFDTVSFCLSKGMGCPLGSVLMGSEEDIYYARNIRKMVGGGMRQAGMTAACALVALEDWEEKLSADNANARFLAHALATEVEGINCDESVCQTNMFVFSMDKSITNPKRSSGKQKIDHIGLSKILREQYNILTFPTF